MDKDKHVPLFNVVRSGELEGYLTIRGVFYSKLKMLDDHSFIAEIHQQHPMADVEVVIPNMIEAKTIHLMMSKNIVAYVLNYLVDVGMTEQFVKALLK